MELLAANPLFLWLLPLAGLPVLFHLFLRVKKRMRSFPSLMFFQRADPRLSARRRIREWLALLLRILALLFLLLALARPQWMGAGRGGRTAMVIVLDNSASMAGAAEGGRRKLDMALQAAGSLVTEQRDEDMTGIALLVDDPDAVLPDGLTSDRDALRGALQRITPTEAFGSPASAMEAAAVLLEGSPAARMEIHVLTDLQSGEWERAAEAAARPPPRTAILVHRLSSAPVTQANVTPTQIRLPSRRHLAGRPGTAAVTLFNPTAIDGSVRFHAIDDRDQKQSSVVVVPATSSRTAFLTLEPRTPGFHWAKAWVEGDSLNSDDVAYAGFMVAARQRVLLVGAAEDFGTLPTALSPAGDGHLSGLQVEIIRKDDLAAQLDDDTPVLVGLSWRNLTAVGTDAARRLHDYVTAGGALLVVRTPLPASRVGGTPDWVGAVPIEDERRAEGVEVLVFDQQSALWDEMRDESGGVQLGGVRAFDFTVLQPAAGSRALLGLPDGRVVFCETPMGNGVVYASGLPFDPERTTLPLKASYLALTQSAALATPQGAAGLYRLTAGERLLAPGLRAAGVQIASLVGGPLDWRGGGANLPVFARTGVYRITADAHESFAVVSAASEEGRGRYVEGEAAPVLGLLTHRVRDFRSADSFLAAVRRSRTGIDLFVPLLALALLAVLTEGWVVNPTPVRRRRARPLEAAA